jgi:hypothetical protein
MPETQTIRNREGTEVLCELRTMKPTAKHRLAIRPGILGTVYGYNAAGVERYFDYDREAALAYAGITRDSDVRLARSRVSHKWEWWVK